MFNCNPRKNKIRYTLKYFLPQKWISKLFCTKEHGLCYIEGYTSSNGWYECPECGISDFSGKLKVDYKKYPWYDFK